MFDSIFSCLCEAGYRGNLCLDIDECLEESSTCAVNAACQNTDGSYKCFCNEGYFGNGQTCSIGECDESVCQDDKQCVSATTIECECKTGYLSDNNGTCFDIDECLSENLCDQNAICTNSVGSYSCECETGFHGDGEVCSFGSCSDESCPTNEVCVSLTTSDCKCQEGFERSSNQECVDIDECSSEMTECDTNAQCLNTFGSFSCRCNQNFYGNGKYCSRGQCNDAVCPVNQKCKSLVTTG